MISVTRLNGSEAVINAELIELIEANPDTMVTLTTGRKVLVEESPQELIERVRRYQQVIRRERGRDGV